MKYVIIVYFYNFFNVSFVAEKYQIKKNYIRGLEFAPKKKK